MEKKHVPLDVQNDNVQVLKATLYIVWSVHNQRTNHTQDKTFYKTMEGVLSCKLGGILEFPMPLQASCVAEQFTHQLCVSVLCYQI